LAATTTKADEVVLVPDATVPAAGGRLRGEITRETPERITIDGRSVPLDQVAEIEYSVPGQPYIQAKAAERNGNLPEAADLYARAAEEASDELVAQDARYRRAALLARLAQSDPGRRDEAIAALRSITTGLSNSRHYGPALKRLAQLQLSAGDYDEADETLSKLARLSWAADEAAVLHAQVMAERGQSEQALRELDGLIARLPEDSTARRRAILAKAEALADLSRFEQAERTVRSVIESADPEDAATLAPAYNTLGQCLRAAGSPRDALFAYLHTDILYSSQADEHARALAAIAQLWRVLERGDRAARVVERLQSEYPNSPHLSAASEPAPGG